MYAKLFVTLAAGLLGGAAAYAANQGSMGGISTGSLDIRTQKLAGVRITELDDITFAASTTAPPPQSDPVCVHSTSGSYLITATSDHGSGTIFRMRDGSRYIAYGVGWYPSASGGTATALSSGIQSPTFTGADATSQTCATTIDTARVEITVDGISFANAQTGTYNDTLTLVVAPQ